MTNASLKWTTEAINRGKPSGGVRHIPDSPVVEDGGGLCQAETSLCSHAYVMYSFTSNHTSPFTINDIVTADCVTIDISRFHHFDFALGRLASAIDWPKHDCSTDGLG